MWVNYKVAKSAVAEGTSIVNEIEMELPFNNILKADAVAKSGNDTRVGMSALERRRLESLGRSHQSAVEL